jgi:hypothetical protein
MSLDWPAATSAPSTSLLPALIQRGQATAEHIEGLLAAVLLESDRAVRAAPGSRWGTPPLLRSTIEESFAEAELHSPELMAPSLLHTARCAQLGLVTFREDLLVRRAGEGRIRASRGGLRAEHVAFLPGATIVGGGGDEAFRFCDVAADLAALRVDLEMLEAPALAAALVEGYTARTGDHAPSLLELYSSLHALRRGSSIAGRLRREHASARQIEKWSALAKRHFDLAYFHALFLQRPVLILLAGPSTPARTEVARALARRLGAPLHRSRDVRNELAGVPASENETAVLGPEHFTPRFNELTYDELAERARRHLVKGATVIIEAGYSRREPLRAVTAMAQASGAVLLGFKCRGGAPAAAGEPESEPRELAPWIPLRLDRPGEEVAQEALEAVRGAGSPVWRAPPTST